MKRILQIQLVFLFFTTIIFSQKTNYSSLLISKELRENANAVIRYQTREITIEAIDKIVVYEKKVVTVLNKAGNVDARIGKGYDDDTKITLLSARVYDALGTEIKKYSKGKFLDISAVSSGTLYSDSRVKYIDYTPTTYPYTLVFESEYKSSSTGFIPTWFPTNGYYVGVEKSEYKLKNPLKITIRTKKNNFEEYGVQDLSSDINLHYVLENLSGIKLESGSVSSREFMPHLKVGLDKFTVKKIQGEASSWKELGKWEYDVLYKDEDNISEKTKEKILSLVEDIENPVEKAKIIYNFVQNKTRYINVSIGIGGLKPMKSEVVDKLGYGDCKGLTNYTRALLKVVGVKSYFTELYAGKTKLDMDFDFPVIHGNHVILNIPNEGNDIWLECTNQIMPFGFLGDFTDDRDVLVITPEGAIKKRTPAYLNETNLQQTSATIQFDEKGNLTASLKRVSKGIQYDDKFGYETLSEEDLIKRYKSDDWSYNNNLEINTVKLENDKKNIVFTEDLAMSIKDYASINQGEFLFRVNVFNRINYVPKRYRKRKLPLQISRGYKDIDEFTIKIPKGYSLEFIPETKELSTKFGMYKAVFEKIDESTLLYKKEILIKSGIYPKEDYKAYRSFRRSIAKNENIRIAIIKK